MSEPTEPQAAPGQTRGGPGDGPPRATGTTRERILRAAADLVGELGVGAITTRAVSERAGVNNALVHYHFGTKGALIVEALVADMGDWMAEPERTLADATSVGAGGAAQVRWLAGLDPEDPRTRILVELTAEALRDRAMLPVVSGALRDFREGLKPTLAALAPGASAEEIDGLAVVLAALLDGLAFHRMLEPDLDLEPAASVLARWLHAPDDHEPPSDEPASEAESRNRPGPEDHREPRHDGPHDDQERTQE
ncbi:MAG: TetR/AcrR family transcriptional regulator [Actinomycetota bacterium]|nr:TetR/AcrR family transcriptional regulator [Actinomycetota bacterium]